MLEWDFKQSYFCPIRRGLVFVGDGGSVIS
jgi:hypothetical protein